MNFNHLTLALAGLVTMASAGAMANNVNNVIDLTGDTIFYGALHSDNSPFIDTFDFSGVAGRVFASATLNTIGFIPEQNIDFLNITLNGVPLVLSPNGDIETGNTEFELELDGPLQLIVEGETGAGDGVFSSYSGTLNVRPIPEPATLTMLALGGIMLVRRRRAA